MIKRIFICGLLVTLIGCSPHVLGGIPPETFQFVAVVEPDRDPQGSGWQVAQVLVLLGHLSSLFPRSSTCDVEVGVPIVNRRQGYIPRELAQAKSATAADRAARAVLGERLPTATACSRFYQHMKDVLSRSIAGARVTKFKTPNVPRNRFPKERHR